MASSSPSSSFQPVSRDNMDCLYEEEQQQQQNEQYHTNKSMAIQDCLRGGRTTDDRMIDLWQLREFALSPGGLLEPNIRKRAWPILTGVTQSLMTTTPEETTTTNHRIHQPSSKLSSSELHVLQNDVRHTVWNVQEHFTQQLKIQQQNRSRVNFSPVLNVEKKNQQQQPQDDDDADEKKIDNHHHHDDEEELDEPSTTSRTTHQTSTSIWSHSVASCRRVRWRTASIAEQKIIINVITSVLRSTPPPPAFDEKMDDRLYHYYTGFHDLTALIMVNLESPSLSSLVLTKLASYHLRDAMQKPTTTKSSILDSAIQHIFFPVLQNVDPELYQHLIVDDPSSFSSSTTLLGILRGWIASWFASDITDVAAASRLIDAFVVSHPTMPIYTAVAFLTHHRQRILRLFLQKNKKSTSSDTIATFIRNLPVFLFQEDDEEEEEVEYDDEEDALSNIDSVNVPATRVIAMKQIEKIIASTLEYMERVPPDTLGSLEDHETQLHGTTTQEHDDEIPTVVMLQPTSQIAPEFYLANTSWNEYAMLQRAKRLREGEDVITLSAQSREKLSSNHGWTQYPLASIATGIKQQSSTEQIWDDPQVRSRFRAFIIAVIVIFLLAEPRESSEWRNAIIVNSNRTSNTRFFFQKAQNKPLPSRKNRVPSKKTRNGLSTTQPRKSSNQKTLFSSTDSKQSVSNETSTSRSSGTTLSSSPNPILATVQDVMDRMSSPLHAHSEPVASPSTSTIPTPVPKSSASSSRLLKDDEKTGFQNCIAIFISHLRNIQETMAKVPEMTIQLSRSIQSATLNLLKVDNVSMLTRKENHRENKNGTFIE